uniref:lipoprotein n=1 Tax=Bacteroides fragilis TaxID=817 RepID=UPI00356410C3
MRKYLFYLLALLFVTACNDEFGNNDPNHGENLPFGTNAKFLRLQDDSTNVAGVLEIKAKTPNVKLKWMVSSECNLDTTITEVRLSGGRYQLPIKWAGKLKDGMYGPISSAYIAGVQVISGEESKYVPLVWADEVDSLEIIKRVEEQNIMTRSGTGEFATEIITLLDSVPFQLDKDTCGKIRFETSAALLLTAKNELTDLVNENNFNLDISKIKSTYIGSPNSLDFLWTDAGAPEQDFMGHVKLIPAGSTIGKYVYFQYKVPSPKKWEFIECIPDSLSTLPATGATVVVIANTNREWSLKYRKEDGTVIESKSQGTASGEQSLLIRIPDNTSLISRNILVDVYSQNELDRTLRFTQQAAEGSFTIVSVVPKPEDGELSAVEQKIKVTVDTARDWWISYGGKKENFLDSQNEGEVTIPANDGTTTRSIVVTVGYDNTLVGTYTYTQGIGNELTYNDSDMPTKIPVDGGTYTFLFEGTYVGNLQVRAVLADGTIVATSPSTTNKQPVLTIPNNYGSREDLNLKFEFKKGTEEWAPLDEVRVQDKAMFDFDVLPTIDIPREGTTVTGSFTGTFRSSIKMKAVSGGVTLAEKDGSTPGNVNLPIPRLDGTEDREIEFFYSLDNGTTWISMGTRTQVAGTIIVGTVTPTGIIPSEGKHYNCSFSGTYPAEITFRARTGTTELDSQKGKLPIVFELEIPANSTSGQREIIFEYSKDGTTWIPVETRVQTSNVPVEGGDNEVGEFDKEGDINGGAEL